MAPQAQSEVIQEWADYVPAPGTVSSSAGPYTFERGRMEKAVRKVCVEMPEEIAQKNEKKKKDAAAAAGTSTGIMASKKVKKEDVDFLYKELLLTRTQAEVALQEAGGDLRLAIKSVMLS